MVSSAFAWRPIFFLGEISYAIYLWHHLLFEVYYFAFKKFAAHLNHGAAQASALIVFWATVLFVAYISYRLVEVPGRRFVRKIEAKLFPVEDSTLRAQELAVSKDLSRPVAAD